MEINKQLFEDVLSGKLKGTFVLRNGKKITSYSLQRNSNHYSKTNPYLLKLLKDELYLAYSYTSNGRYLIEGETFLDVIDFIPDTDMKENELTIEIPDGKIVDWDESKKQNKIVLKDKQLTYEEICDRLPGMIDVPLFDTPSEDGNALVVNEHYLECLLAKNKLATVAKYLNDGWKPLRYDNIFVLAQMSGGVSIFAVVNGSIASDCGTIWFKTEELAQQAIEILGEETVKLALEPLGI